MTENNEHYEEHNLKHNTEHECFHRKHPLISHLLTAFLVFIGAFLAFYLIADWHYKQMFNPAHQIKNIEKMMMKDSRAMQKMLQKDFRAEKTTESYIMLDETPAGYIISVNLKPFNNDAENVSITIDDDVLTVHATNEKNKKNHSEILAISQSYAFPAEVDFNKISKERNGNKYLISIPFAK